MSAEQISEVAPERARRRIVALPRPAEAPVALIARDPEQRAAMETQLSARRVIAFPSLAHFCSEPPDRERWAGIVVARPCAWDAQLDRYVPYRECIALYGVTDEEGYGWPESVQRPRAPEEFDAWLNELFVPMPRWRKDAEEERDKRRKARAEARRAKQRAATNGSRHQRAVELGTSANGQEAGTAPKVENGEPVQRRFEFADQPAGESTASAAAARAPRKRGRAEVRASAPRAARAGGRGAGRARESRRADTSAELAQARALAKREASIRAVLRTAGNVRPSARVELEFIALVGEIGLNRAVELLTQVRSNAAKLLARR